ncbi:MAG: SIS domain-containing protein [Myxococcaceae bacterium]
MREAILRKARESAAIKVAFFEEYADELETCVREMAARFREGGRLWTFGNGGSSCDADHLAVEFTHPVIEKRRPLPAASLVHPATLTAIGNDTDFSRVFDEQLDLFARPGDMAIGVSTSGSSANVTRALRRARAKRVLAIGFAGRDGGQMVDACDHCFIVKTWSAHRVQETHTALLHLIWDQLHVALGEEDVL